MADSYKPTEGMIAEANRGLEWRKEFGRGGTSVGIARARDISETTQMKGREYILFILHAFNVL